MNQPVLIARQNVPIIWPVIGQRLQAAMEKLKFVEFDLPSMFKLLMAEQAQLWSSADGEMIAITRIIQFQETRRLVVDFIEGKNHEDYADQMEYLEAWAISLGATQAEAEIRPGLLAEAKRQGWERQRIKVFKTLKRGLH